MKSNNIRKFFSLGLATTMTLSILTPIQAHDENKKELEIIQVDLMDILNENDVDPLMQSEKEEIDAESEINLIKGSLYTIEDLTTDEQRENNELTAFISTNIGYEIEAVSLKTNDSDTVFLFDDGEIQIGEATASIIIGDDNTATLTVENITNGLSVQPVCKEINLTDSQYPYEIVDITTVYQKETNEQQFLITIEEEYEATSITVFSGEDKVIIQSSELTAKLGDSEVTILWNDDNSILLTASNILNEISIVPECQIKTDEDSDYPPLLNEESESLPNNEDSFDLEEEDYLEEDDTSDTSIPMTPLTPSLTIPPASIPMTPLTPSLTIPPVDDSNPLNPTSSFSLDDYLEDSVSFTDKLEARAVAVGEWITVPGIEGGQIKFDSETGTITDAEETITSAIIPSLINEIEVKAIGPYAFGGVYKQETENNQIRSYGYYQSLTSVSIPNTVELIDSNAFSFCVNLKSFVGCSEVKYFGESCLEETRVLTASSIEFCDELEYIGDYAFARMGTYVTFYPIKETIIPETVTYIGDYAFAGTHDKERHVFEGDSGFWEWTELGKAVVSSVTLPTGLEYLGTGVFAKSGCTNIIFPDDLIKIPDYFASECDALYVANLTAPIEIIGVNAFAESAVSTINFSNTIKEIESNAFSHCANLKNINFSDSIETIGSKAFYSCINLNEISFSDSVRIIGEEAFSCCSSLTAINIPETIDEIKAYAFSCTGLLGTVSLPENPVYGTGVFKETPLTSANLPESMIDVPDEFFQNCMNLKTVSFSSEVRTIGNLTFSDTGIVSMVMPDTIISLGFSSFYSSLIENISLNDGLKSIGSNAFASTPIREIDFPESVNSIGSYAFSNTRLNSITFPEAVTIVSEGVCYACPNLETIFISDNTRTIGDYAFAKTGNIRINTRTLSDRLPESVISIGDYAFAYNGMGIINLNESLQYVGEGVFSNTALRTLTIPRNITSIPTRFIEYSLLEELIFQGDVHTIGWGALRGRGNFSGQVWTIPDSVNEIYDYAFSEITASKIHLPNNNDFNYIREGVFSYTAMQYLSIPETVTYIGEMAFAGASLRILTIPNGVTQINNSFVANTKYLDAVLIPASVINIESGTGFGSSAFFFVEESSNAYTALSTHYPVICIEHMKININANDEYDNISGNGVQYTDHGWASKGNLIVDFVAADLVASTGEIFDSKRILPTGIYIHLKDITVTNKTTGEIFQVNRNNYDSLLEYNMIIHQDMLSSNESVAELEISATNYAGVTTTETVKVQIDSAYPNIPKLQLLEKGDETIEVSVDFGTETLSGFDFAEYAFTSDGVNWTEYVPFDENIDFSSVQLTNTDNDNNHYIGLRIKQTNKAGTTSAQSYILDISPTKDPNITTALIEIDDAGIQIDATAKKSIEIGKADVEIVVTQEGWVGIKEVINVTDNRTLKPVDIQYDVIETNKEITYMAIDEAGNTAEKTVIILEEWILEEEPEEKDTPEIEDPEPELEDAPPSDPIPTFPIPEEPPEDWDPDDLKEPTPLDPYTPEDEPEEDPEIEHSITINAIASKSKTQNGKADVLVSITMSVGNEIERVQNLTDQTELEPITEQIDIIDVNKEVTYKVTDKNGTTDVFTVIFVEDQAETSVKIKAEYEKSTSEEDKVHVKLTVTTDGTTIEKVENLTDGIVLEPIEEQDDIIDVNKEVIYQVTDSDKNTATVTVFVLDEEENSPSIPDSDDKDEEYEEDKEDKEDDKPSSNNSSTTKPEDDYVYVEIGKDTIPYLKGTNNIAEISSVFANEVYYLPQEDGTYEFKENPKVFDDMDGHWSEEYVAYVASREVMTGTAVQVFSPDVSLTRGMAAQIMFNIHNSFREYEVTQNNFTDVPETMYYYTAINWCADNNILAGIGEDLYAPERAITREELFAILYNAYNFSAEEDCLDFKDSDDIVFWAKEAMNSFTAKGLLAGYNDNSVRPKQDITRAEFCVMIQVIHEYVLLNSEDTVID